MKTEKLRWGLLGTARVNEKILPHLASSERSRVEAVASRSAEKALDYAKTHGIPRAHGDYAALLADPEVDVVYLALPNHLHFEWARRALESGKHVLCEKPLALSGTEASLLAQLAEEKGRTLSEGFMYRHHAQTKRLLDLLDPTSVSSCSLGKIQRIQASFHITVAPGPNVRTSGEPGSGALFDVGCYLVDYCLALMGRAPREVFATAKFASAGYDEFISGTLIFENDAIAQIDCGFRGPRIDRLEVLCERGWVRIPHPFKPGAEETLTVHRRPNRDSPETFESFEIGDSRDPYLAEIRDFESAIREKRSTLVSPLESIATAATLEALLASARSGRPEKPKL